jgi:hypothetical protein
MLRKLDEDLLKGASGHEKLGNSSLLLHLLQSCENLR